MAVLAESSDTAPSVPPETGDVPEPAMVTNTSTRSAPSYTVPSMAPMRSLSKRNLQLGVGTLVLIVAGGVLYAALRPSPATPASTVQQYFDDLAKGDTSSALALVADRNQTGDGSSQTLLTARALAAAQSRPTDVHVGNATNAGFGSLASLYRVEVSYKAGGANVSTSIDVIKAPPRTHSSVPYLLSNPFITVQVGNPGGRPVTVNGIALSVDQNSTFSAFPGAYTATAAGNELLAGDTVRASMSPDAYSGTTQAVMTFPPPRLSPGAQDTVKAQIKQHLDTCAQSTDANPSNCPFNLYSAFIGGNVSTVQWSISAYPAVNVTAAASPSPDNQVDFADPSQDGVAHYVATYTDFSGATQTAAGDVDFGVNGTASASGGTITLSFQ